MMKNLETIGQRLRKLRGETSQKAAAISTGIRQQVWNRYEKDQTAPASDSIIKICNTFRCSADWLLGLSDGNERGTSVNAPNNSGAIAVGKNARATSGGTPGVRPLPDCANCKYKRLADAFKAL